jgi:hypothetical protein
MNVSAPGNEVAGEFRRTITRHQTLWLILAVGCLAAFVDVVVANRSGLWMDEVFSLAMATGHSLDHPAHIADPKHGDFVEVEHALPADELRRYLEHDNPLGGPGRVMRAVSLSGGAPPLYYLLLYGWTIALGTSDIVLRLFSIICSLACLLFVASIARRLGGSRAVFPSCALFAFSPLTIYFATEGRMYSLLLLCVLALMWASLILAEDGASLKIGAVWVLASAAGFLTHYFFVFPWLGIVAYLLISRGKFRRLNLAVCLLLTVVLIFPWYIKLPFGTANWRVTVGWMAWSPPGFDRTRALFETPLRFFTGRSQLWRGDPRDPFNPLALVLFSVVAVIALWRLRLQLFGGARLLLWFVFGAACLGPLAFDLVEHTYTMANPRFSIAALASAYLLAGLALASMKRPMMLIGLTLIILTWLPDISCIYRQRLPFWPLREIAHAASASNSSSDVMLVHAMPSELLGIARYATGPAPLASWIHPPWTDREPASVHELIAGRTRVIFVWNVLEPAPEEKWLTANSRISHASRMGWWRILDLWPINSKTF